MKKRIVSIKQAVLSGEDIFDLAAQHVVSLGQIATSDYFMNWYDIPNIDFSKPWRSDSTVKDLTYNDVCIIAIGDFALTALSNAYCIYYNITSRIVYDMGYVYHKPDGCAFIMQTLVTNGTPNFESYWASIESKVTLHYESVAEYFENYG